jgi:hypothetical protein
MKQNIKPIGLRSSLSLGVLVANRLNNLNESLPPRSQYSLDNIRPRGSE